MANLNIFDDDGEIWIRNIGDFRMPHPTRERLIFEPGQPTKVHGDDWISGQPVLEEMDDPLAAPKKSKADKAEKQEDQKK